MKTAKNYPMSLFEDKRLQQNRKVLRYRACLAQVAVVCVGIKNLNGELLSFHFCQFFKDNSKSLNIMRKAIQMEIQRQSAIGWVQKEPRSSNSFFNSSRFLFHKGKASLRLRFLLNAYSFCDVLLSELHVLNYEHISDRTYNVLGELIELYSIFRQEIAKERELQSQCKSGRILQNAS